MDMVLSRSGAQADGVFGNLVSTDGNFVCFTLEHAYADTTEFLPKVPAGTYICVRGMHILDGMSAAFETFEVTNVPNHTGILFHVGNYNKDSSGCILLGETLATLPNGMMMLTNSKKTFQKFMELQTGCDQFTLAVVE